MWLVSVWCRATPKTEALHFPLHLHLPCHPLPHLHHCPHHCPPHCHHHCHLSLLIPLSPVPLLLLPPSLPTEREKGERQLDI